MRTKRRKITNYFAGAERLASAIGNGGLADIGNVNGTSLATSAGSVTRCYSA